MTAATGVVSGVRVSHDTASLEDVETACRGDEGDLLRRLAAVPGVEEAFALRTCNRFEAYVVTDDATTGRAVLSEFTPDVADGAVVEMGHEESLRHLLRVAAGLESLVLGEDQILGQVRDAAEAAREADALGAMLEDAVTKAVHVGERARAETAINDGAVSVGSAAVRLLGERSDLDSAVAVVVGAGEMGTIAAHALADAGVEALYVANRSLDGATDLVEAVDHDAVRGVRLDGVPSVLSAADVAITATAGEGYALEVEDLEDVGELIVVDIAQPRDVPPGADALAGVTVHDMSALTSVTDETERRRRAAAESVEAMIDREFERLLEGYKRKRANEVISTMYESAERVKERELAEAVSKLEAHGDLPTDQREAVTAMADALVSQLLAPPTRSLREAAAEDDWATIDTALRLFDPEFGEEGDPGAGGGPPSFVGDGATDPEAVPEDLAERFADDPPVEAPGDDD